MTNLINYVSIEDGLQRKVKGRDCGMHKKAAVRKEPGVPQEWGVLEPHLNAGGADENRRCCLSGQDKYPLVCGPYCVNLPDAISAHTLAHIEELDGTTHGHFNRIPIKLLIDQ